MSEPLGIIRARAGGPVVAYALGFMAGLWPATEGEPRCPYAHGTSDEAAWRFARDRAGRQKARPHKSMRDVQ